MDLANVTWSFDRLADGSIHACAWSTDSGAVVADSVAPTKSEAGRDIYRQLAAKFRAYGKTLVSKNGDRLTADGPLDLRGEVSSSL